MAAIQGTARAIKEGKRRTVAMFIFAVAISVFTTLVSLQWVILKRNILSQTRQLSHGRSADVPFVAIVSCIKSSGYRPSDGLKNYLIPSIHQTLTEDERTTYRVELILGYDEGDPYWQHRHNQLEAETIGNSGTAHPIPVSFVSIPKERHQNENRIPFNELCQAAYDCGATYIVRINDDSEFKTSGWITLAIRTLLSYAPPNVGVVGPTCHQGNTEILTHDMVHAPTHYQIFDTYYPPIFDNYYIDDWMTHVYGHDRTTMIKEWEVIHHLNKYGTRYHPTFHHDSYLNETIKEGKENIRRFLLSTLTGKGDSYGGGKRLEKQRVMEQKH